MFRAAQCWLIIVLTLLEVCVRTQMSVRDTAHGNQTPLRIFPWDFTTNVVFSFEKTRVRQYSPQYLHFPSHLALSPSVSYLDCHICSIHAIYFYSVGFIQNNNEVRYLVDVDDISTIHKVSWSIHSWTGTVFLEYVSKSVPTIRHCHMITKHPLGTDTTRRFPENVPETPDNTTNRNLLLFQQGYGGDVR